MLASSSTDRVNFVQQQKRRNPSDWSSLLTLHILRIAHSSTLVVCDSTRSDSSCKHLATSDAQPTLLEWAMPTRGSMMRDVARRALMQAQHQPDKGKLDAVPNVELNP